jgi:hypothetical protein
LKGLDSAEHEGPRVAIHGWKSIAAYFEVTIRTAQHWEAELGMPVHREVGAPPRVFAYADELEAWMAARREPRGPETKTEPVRARPWRGLAWVAAAAALVIAAAGAVRLAPGGAPPASAVLKGRNLVALDAGGRAVWQHEFPKAPDPYWGAQARSDGRDQTRPLTGDFDGDGRVEVLFTYFSQWRAAHIAEVYCFESDGTVRWKYRPGRTVRDRNMRYDPPHSIWAVIPIPGQRTRPGVVAVVSNHHVEHPSQVSILSMKGELLGEYWHSGYFYAGAAADLEGDGRTELYLAGISNANREATVVALDPYRLKGAARESNPDFQLNGFEDGEEAARILLPATSFTRQTGEFPVARRVEAREGRLIVRVCQRHSDNCEPDAAVVEYEFGPRLVLRSWGYRERIDALVERLVKEGVMKGFDVRAEIEGMGQVRVLTPWREAAAKAGK